MITSNLMKFGMREIETAQKLLEQLNHCSIEVDGCLGLKFNTSSGSVFLASDSQTFVLGNNDELCECEIDDYGREYNQNFNLKYDGNTAQDFESASIIQRELIEFDAITSDYDDSAVKDAIKHLEDEREKQIVEALQDATKIQDYDSEITDTTLTLLSNTMDAISSSNKYEIKDEIQNALNSLKVVLEQ